MRVDRRLLYQWSFNQRISNFNCSANVFQFHFHDRDHFHNLRSCFKVSRSLLGFVAFLKWDIVIEI
jgi:hypothetical protein